MREFDFDADFNQHQLRQLTQLRHLTLPKRAGGYEWTDEYELLCAPLFAVMPHVVIQNGLQGGPYFGPTSLLLL